MAFFGHFTQFSSCFHPLGLQLELFKQSMNVIFFSHFQRALSAHSDDFLMTPICRFRSARSDDFRRAQNAGRKSSFLKINVFLSLSLLLVLAIYRRGKRIWSSVAQVVRFPAFTSSIPTSVEKFYPCVSVFFLVTRVSYDYDYIAY